MVRVEDLKKRLGHRQILDGVNLSVPRGECLAVCGPSGCGKTTLLRLIAGLDDADAGTIRLDGELASAPHAVVPPHRRRIGMVFQDLALWPHMTALAHVEFMLGPHERQRRARRERAREVLANVQLSRNIMRYPHELSGGERQRVALARALAAEPAVLLLDEPFCSLHRELKNRMLALVRELHASRAITTLYVTHIPSDLPGLAERVACMADGVITGVSATDAFVAQRAARVGGREP